VPCVVDTVPPRISDSAADYTVTEGSSVRLVCDVVDGDPEPEVTWSRDGQRMSDVDGAAHYIVDAGSLEVLSAGRQDGGSYVCTAVNVAGQQQKHIRLRVHSQLFHTHARNSRSNHRRI